MRDSADKYTAFLSAALTAEVAATSIAAKVT